MMGRNFRQMRQSNTPVALTIAGSDSGGEAGIQADLNTFAHLGVHGTTAITCLTAQNARRISRLEPCSPGMVRAQLEAVGAHFDVAAAKTGMLYSAGIVREAALFMRRHSHIPLVVDPVMVSTSGRRLLQCDGIEALKKLLLPLAAIATPNLAEAEILAGGKIRSLEQLRAAAGVIHRRFGCAALVKGGHLAGSAEAVDFFHGPEGEWMLSAPREANATLHGTGCTYSAAITAWLARGKSPVRAIALAKQYITGRIKETQGK
jgi:hydroxymethylpyrimidine/phosphomethylpyrimidine kinase